MSWTKLFKRNKSVEQEAANTEVVNTAGQITAESEAELAANQKNAEDDARIAAAKVQHKAGQLEEAEAVYLDISEKNPSHAEAWHLLGVVCLQRGQMSEAEGYLRKAIALDNQKAAYYTNLGNVLGAQDRTGEAYQCFTRALSLDPKNLSALSNIATCLLSMDRISEAKPYCLRILEIVPDDTDARLNLAAVFIAERNMHAAVDVLRQALSIKTHDADLLFQLASALEYVNEIEEAATVIQRALVVEPDSARVSMLAGLIARRQKKYDVAEQHLKKAMEIGLSDKEQIEGFNQLGLTLDAMGKAREAFATFEHANKLMAQFFGEEKASGESFLKEVAAARAFFSKEKSEELATRFETDDDFRPVFFVGFPRSGTTLLEQVLKAHPKLVTTDERSPLSAVITELRNLPGGYPYALDDMSSEDLIGLRQTFREYCWNHVDDLQNKQLVDKLPMNIVYLGLAKLLFPNAKILVALRDPRDACLSCFMQKFVANPAMANFLDLQTTGQAYAAVMGCWLEYRATLDDSWLEYHYESLVENFDDTVTRILDFIGVGWHEDIISYRQAAKKRVVTTPSYRDVTEPVNNRAMARWRRYQHELAPILPVLQPFVEAFGYEEQTPQAGN